MVFLTQKEDPTMARRRGHTEVQILAALREAGVGATVVDVCWQVGFSSRHFTYGGASVRGWASLNCANWGSSVRRMPS